MSCLEQKMILKLNVEQMYIVQSYFRGKLNLHVKNYDLNLQVHSSEKIVKLSFHLEKLIDHTPLSEKKIFR